MPTISIFHGIRIVMFLRGKEHNPPHVHAFYNDFAAPFSIDDGEIMDGVFPQKEKALVKEFVLHYQKELEEMWENQQFYKLPPVV